MLPSARYTDGPSRIAFYRRVLDESRRIPGAVAAGISTTLPLSGSNIGIGLTLPRPP